MAVVKALVYQPDAARWAACKLLGVFRKQVFWGGLSGLRYAEVAVPELPGPQWVRLRTVLGGICGTDLGLILQKNHPASYLAGLTSFPVVLGHENLAILDEVGADVSGWQRGDRVCVEPALSCVPRGINPVCRPCAAGQFSLCENVGGVSGPAVGTAVSAVRRSEVGVRATAASAVLKSVGLPMADIPMSIGLGRAAGTMIGLNAFTGGSWAPFFVAHRSQLHWVPDAIPDEQAVLTDPLACCLHGVLRRIPQNDEHVLVHGAGVIGLGVAACIRALGSRARITAIARHRFQQDWLDRLGVDHVIRFPRKARRRERYDLIATHVGGRRIRGRFGNHGLLGGFDVVYDCIGTGDSMADSLKFTRARGTTVLLGTSGITLLDTTPLWNKELTVLGGFGRQLENHNWPRQHTYEMLFDLIRRGKLNLDGWLTHTFAPQDYNRAFRTLTSRGRKPAIKAAFRFS